MERDTSITERAMAVPPSRAFVLEVTAFAPSTIVTTPSTPTRRINIATSTSTRVKPAWAEERAREAIQTATRPRARPSREDHLPMAIGAMADPIPLANFRPGTTEGGSEDPPSDNGLLVLLDLPATGVAAAS
jgi:hypothetical protein